MSPVRNYFLNLFQYNLACIFATTEVTHVYQWKINYPRLLLYHFALCYAESFPLIPVRTYYITILTISFSYQNPEAGKIDQGTACFPCKPEFKSSDGSQMGSTGVCHSRMTLQLARRQFQENL